jgi:hypothetical protein
LSKNNFAEICTGTYGKNAGEADEVLIFTTKIASRVVLALIKGKHKKKQDDGSLIPPSKQIIEESSGNGDRDNINK